MSEHISDQYEDDFPYPHLDPDELADGGESVIIEEKPF